MKTKASSAGAWRWVLRGGWAILDQGLFAVANFVLNVLLARLLTPQEYGLFSVAYAVLLLAGTLHTAFLTEPMLVFGPGRFEGRFLPYLRVLVQWHWRLTGALALAFAALGLGFLVLASDGSTFRAFVAMSVATPLILVQWLYRRSCYVRLQPQLAVQSGALYFTCLVAGVLALARRGLLTTATAFVLLACASLVGSAWIHWRLAGTGDSTDSAGLDVRDAARAHLDYGRWAAGTAVLSWVPGNVYYLLLPLVASVEEVAGLRAAMNLILPVLHVIAALGLLLLPALVKRIQSGAPIGRVASRISLAFVAGALLYGLLLLAAGDWLLNILYEGKYDDYGGLVLPLAFLPIASALVAVLGGVIRAYERPDLVFRVYVWTCVVTGSLGLGLVLLSGAQGAAIGLLVSSVTTATLMGRFVFGSGLRDGTRA